MVPKKKVKNKECSSGHFEHTPKTPSLRGLRTPGQTLDWPARSKVTAILLLSKFFVPEITVLKIRVSFTETENF